MKNEKIIDWDNGKSSKKKPKAQQAPTGQPALDVSGFVGGYFKPLGYDTEDRSMMYYFFVRETMSIVKMKPSALVKNNILMLAPLEFWITSFPNRDSSNFNAMAVSDFLISACNYLGFYNTDDIRGRGAWQESDRVIFHTGQNLITDKTKYQLGSIQTEYTYEQRKELKIPIEQPMDKKESAHLTKILQKLNFATKSDSRLLAGWLAIAPICGVLKWRPHIWITGPRGNGKSWVLENIVQTVIGSMAVSVQGTAATEPAVRQKLNSDALPVTIDEGEGNDDRAAQRMQEIIGLARAASSEKSPAIAKGGKDGKAIDYYIRSCFLIVSINPQLVNDSDKRRFCILELAKLSEPSEFVKVEKFRATLFDNDYGVRFQARMLTLVENIKKSIAIFTAAVSELTEDRAIGDQYGALLGGWWHTWNDDVVSAETALQESAAILELRNVMEEKEDLTDEERCLQHIFSQEVRIEAENFVGTKTIGELVEYARNYQPSVTPTQDEANTRLMRLGLRVIDNNLLILNTSVYVKSILRHTPWAVSWNQVLLRLPGAKRKGNTRFSAGLSGRCISIDLKNF